LRDEAARRRQAEGGDERYAGSAASAMSAVAIPRMTSTPACGPLLDWAKAAIEAPMSGNDNAAGARAKEVSIIAIA